MSDEWEVLAAIPIRARLSIADTSYFYDDPLIVAVEGGVYEIGVRYGVAGGHRYVSAVRAVRRGTMGLRRRLHVGDVKVEFNQIGLCDRDAVLTAFDALGDGGMAQYYEQLNTTELAFVVWLPEGAAMPVVRSPALGDGVYAVYQFLREDGATWGVEVDCESDYREPD